MWLSELEQELLEILQPTHWQTAPELKTELLKKRERKGGSTDADEALHIQIYTRLGRLQTRGLVQSRMRHNERQTTLKSRRAREYALTEGGFRHKNSEAGENSPIPGALRPA